MSQSVSRRDGALSLNEFHVDEHPALEQAAAAKKPAPGIDSNTKSHVEKAWSPQKQATVAEEAVRTAVEKAVGLLSYFVSDDDAKKAGAALAELKPEQLKRALYALHAAGKLPVLTENLAPKDLAKFTEMLVRGDVFQWKPAVDEKGSAISGGLQLLKTGENLPEALKALAHDINLSVAKQHPGTALFEPGSNQPLNTREGNFHVWEDSRFGEVGRAFTATQNRYSVITDLDTSVHQLRPGESYRLGADVSAKVGLPAEVIEAGVGGAVSAGVEVTRKADGSYAVSADSSLLQKLGLSVGAPLGPKLKADLAQGGAGKVEFSFGNADDATRGAKTLFEAMSTPLKLVDHPGDVTLLKHNVSALELGPQVSASLGIRAEGPGVVGSKASQTAGAGFAGTQTVRLEFENGEPRAMSVKTSAGFELSKENSAAFGEGVTAEFASGDSVGLRVECEQRADLQGSLEETLTLLKAMKASLTVSMEAKQSNAVNGGTSEVEFKAEGTPRDMLKAAFLLQTGKTAAAAALLERAEVSTRKTASSSLGVNVGFEAHENELSLGLKASRKRQLEETHQTGTGRELALKLLESLGPVKRGAGEKLNQHSLLGD